MILMILNIACDGSSIDCFDWRLDGTLAHCRSPYFGWRLHLPAAVASGLYRRLLSPERPAAVARATLHWLLLSIIACW